MKYTKKIEKIGDTSITEHIVEGNYEEVLALFTELESKDVVEHMGIDWATNKDTTGYINQ